jgi:N-acyl-D-amino-acid deacylase
MKLCRLSLLVWLLAAPTVFHNFSPRQAVSPSYDLVVTNALVDGCGNPGFRADVGVRDGRIVRIGKISAAEARQTIDAKGQILAPGFIDVNTHVESLL